MIGGGLAPPAVEEEAAAAAASGRSVTFVLEGAQLETAQVGKAYALLNCDDHASFLKKHKRDPAVYRPDIAHQALLAILDSPLNKAGARPGRRRRAPPPPAAAAARCCRCRRRAAAAAAAPPTSAVAALAASRRASRASPRP